NQAKVGLLEFHGHGLQPHVTALETDIKNMAALGARLLEGAPVVQETATAVGLRLEGAESPMQGLVKTGSQALSQAVQIHAWWAGMTEVVPDRAIHVMLNSDLLPTLANPNLLQALMEMLLKQTISYETFYYNLQRQEVARPLVSVTDEQALIE